MEMIERVGRALAKADGWAYDPVPYDRWAAAALEAMKITDLLEGVPGGIAFEDAFFGNQETVFHALRDAWNATIDGALARGESPSEEKKDG